MPETTGSGRRLFRRFALGSGPLKRGTDRLQFVARVLLLITVLTAIPVALAVVTANYSQGRTVAAAEAAARHQVTATLLVDAAASTGRRPSRCRDREGHLDPALRDRSRRRPRRPRGREGRFDGHHLDRRLRRRDEATGHVR